MLKKSYRAYNAVRATAIVGLLSAIILLCVVQIILRYFTSSIIKPFAWGDEVVRLSSIWVSFLAASIGVRDSSHLSVDFFIEKLIPKTALKTVKRVATALVLVVLFLLVWYGISRTIANVPTMMQNLPISMAWFYAAIPVGSLFLLLDYLLIAIYGKHPFSSVSKEEEIPLPPANPQPLQKEAAEDA
jgi:TRAP-type C4-dicarboxylate transport system permease small subunit